MSGKYRLVPLANLKLLHAADGESKKIVVNDDGEISEKDKLWLEQNGGPLPPNLIPPQDKVLIQHHAHRRLYAQDGSTKLSDKINIDGTLSQNDIDWIDNHGGPAPLDMIPAEDRVSIVRTHLSSHIEDNRDIYHASHNDLEYEEVLNNNNNNNNNNDIIPSIPGPSAIPVKHVLPVVKGVIPLVNIPNNIGKDQIKNLYALNGAIKQIIVSQDYEISPEDLLWLEENGGPLPSNLIPIDDRVFVQQHPHKYLYAQDGLIKLSLKINNDGTLQQEDIDWLDSHGGPLPLDMIPPDDRVKIRKNINNNNNNNNINNNNNNNVNNNVDNNVENEERSTRNMISSGKVIRLYAMNGKTKQTVLDEHGKISHEDALFLKENGGAKPLSEIPKEDRAYVFAPNVEL